MKESDEFTGVCTLNVGSDRYSGIISINLLDGDIWVYGQFPHITRDPDPFKTLSTFTCTLPDVRLFTHFGTLVGDLGTVRVTSVRQRGSSHLYSGSTINRLINKAPEYSYDKIRVTTGSSLIRLSLEEKFITQKDHNLFYRLWKFFFGAKGSTFPDSEIWFRCHRSRLLVHKVVDINGITLSLDASDGIAAIRSSVPISERHAHTYRVALSFLWGAEVHHIFTCTEKEVILNLIDDEVRNGFSPVEHDHFATGFRSCLIHANTLSDQQFEKFQNDMYLYIAGKSARIYMNSRLALLYVAIEALFVGSSDANLATKIQQLFNLSNPTLPAFNSFTISNSINADQSSSLARIRNLIVHEGFMAESLYSHCSSVGELRSPEILAKCSNNAVSLWLFLVSNLDKYWLNLIRFSGLYVDCSQNFQTIPTIR